MTKRGKLANYLSELYVLALSLLPQDCLEFHCINLSLLTDDSSEHKPLITLSQCIMIPGEREIPCVKVTMEINMPAISCL